MMEDMKVSFVWALRNSGKLQVTMEILKWFLNIELDCKIPHREISTKYLISILLFNEGRHIEALKLLEECEKNLPLIHDTFPPKYFLSLLLNITQVIYSLRNNLTFFPLNITKTRRNIIRVMN